MIPAEFLFKLVAANAPRHPEMLESVFDKDEDFAIDAVEQLQQSLSP